MTRPQFPSRAELARQDRLEELARALAALRRAVRQGGRLDVETLCDGLARRLDLAPFRGDDREEIAAAVGFLRRRARRGLPQRLRRLLLPLVAAIEQQMETSENSILDAIV